MNLSAIEHHSYDEYCYPLNENELKISLRSAKDICKVFLIWGDPFDSVKTEKKWQWKSQSIQMEEKKELEEVFIWSKKIIPPYKRCKYYFELHSENETLLFFENKILSPADFKKDPYGIQLFIFPWMNKADIIAPPKWAEETVWYQIFPARFCRSSNSQVQNVKEWADSKTPVKNKDFFGGNLEGIIEKLDYLEDLGITGLYLNPVNLSASQHKYDTTDYLQIDPEFGSKEIMKNLVDLSHKRGMKVMLDGVFNHTGWNFFAWQDLVKNRQNSAYADWYIVNDWSFNSFPSDGAASGKFFSFAFTDYMPKLNTNNPQVQDYIIGVCKKWIEDYGIDAIRLDVANELSHTFCSRLSHSLKALKKDFFIAGEVWNSAMPWLRSGEFDSVINYPLRNAIYNFAASKEKDWSSLEKEVNKCLFMYFEQTEKVLVNQMDSHDTMRFITKVNGDSDTALLAFALILSLPGSACIYYGSVVLLPGGEDPDCRRCMPWKEIEEGKFNDPRNLIKSLIALRKAHPALRSTEINFCKSAESRLVILERSDKEKGERLRCYFNFTGKGCTVKEEGKVLFAHKYKDFSLQSGGLLLFDL